MIKGLREIAGGGVSELSEWTAVIELSAARLRDLVGDTFILDPSPFLEKKTFSIWMQAKPQSPPASRFTWSGVIGGIAIEDDVFKIDMLVFVFDALDGRRVVSEERDYLYFRMMQRGDALRWENLGWCDDEWDEWTNVGCPTSA